MVWTSVNGCRRSCSVDLKARRDDGSGREFEDAQSRRVRRSNGVMSRSKFKFTLLKYPARPRERLVREMLPELSDVVAAELARGTAG